jgi:hypothetical protein
VKRVLVIAFTSLLACEAGVSIKPGAQAPGKDRIFNF